MEQHDKIQLFEDKRIHTAWNEEKEDWYFSIVDVVAVLTNQPTQRSASNYWAKLKQRLKEEGSELLTNCQQLKMTATDDKQRLTDVAIPSSSCVSFSPSLRPRQNHLRCGWRRSVENGSRKPSTRS